MSLKMKLNQPNLRFLENLEAYRAAATLINQLEPLAFDLNLYSESIHYLLSDGGKKEKCQDVKKFEQLSRDIIEVINIIRTQADNLTNILINPSIPIGKTA